MDCTVSSDICVPIFRILQYKDERSAPIHRLIQTAIVYNGRAHLFIALINFVNEVLGVRHLLELQ